MQGDAAADDAERGAEGGADDGDERERVGEDADAHREVTAFADGVAALAEVEAAVFEIVFENAVAGEVGVEEEAAGEEEEADDGDQAEGVAEAALREVAEGVRQADG